MVCRSGIDYAGLGGGLLRCVSGLSGSRGPDPDHPARRRAVLACGGTGLVPDEPGDVALRNAVQPVVRRHGRRRGHRRRGAGADLAVGPGYGRRAGPQDIGMGPGGIPRRMLRRAADIPEKKPAFYCWKRRQWWPRQAGSFAGEIFSQRKETDKP